SRGAIGSRRCAVPRFRQSLKRIETKEPALGMRVQGAPMTQTLSFEDAKFQVVQRPGSIFEMLGMQVGEHLLSIGEPFAVFGIPDGFYPTCRPVRAVQQGREGRQQK